MKIKLISAVVFLNLLVVSSLGAAEARVGGLQLHFESASKKFKMPPSLNIDMIVAAEGKQILGLVESQSKLTKLEDSTGRDFRDDLSLFCFPSNSGEKEEAVKMSIKVRGKVPAKGATHVDIEGKAVFNAGSETEVVMSDAIDFKEGSKLEVAGFALEVSNAKKPDWGDAKWAVTFESAKPFDAIAGWQVVDAEGNEVETKVGSRGSVGFVGKTTYSLQLQLQEKVSKGSLKLSVYSDFEQIEIPLEARVGLGG